MISTKDGAVGNICIVQDHSNNRVQRPFRVVFLTFAATFAAARTASLFFVALPRPRATREAVFRPRTGADGGGSERMGGSGALSAFTVLSVCDRSVRVGRGITRALRLGPAFGTTTGAGMGGGRAGRDGATTGEESIASTDC